MRGYAKRPCDKCLRSTETRLLTAYGALLCEDCWDDYLFSDEGKVEYIIGLTRGDYPIDYFDADFLGHCAVQWHKNKNQFDFADEEIAHIEQLANLLGLL